MTLSSAPLVSGLEKLRCITVQYYHKPTVYTAQTGGYSVELPQPEYIGSMFGDDSGGALSPKYPSIVTKVHSTFHSLCANSYVDVYK